MVRIPELTPFIVYFRPPSANLMKQHWMPNGIIKVCLYDTRNDLKFAIIDASGQRSSHYLLISYYSSLEAENEVHIE